MTVVTEPDNALSAQPELPPEVLLAGTLAGQQCVLRTAQAQDVGPIVDYWYSDERDLFEKMGIDLERFPTRVVRERFFRGIIRQRPEQANARIFSFLVDDRFTAYCLFNHIVPGVECQAHCHFTAKDMRRRGFSQQFFDPALKAFARALGTPLFIMEPSAENPGINGLLQDLGYRPERTYYKEAQGICRAMWVNRYELRLDRV